MRIKNLIFRILCVAYSERERERERESLCMHATPRSEGCVCSLRSRFSLTLHYRGRSSPLSLGIRRREMQNGAFYQKRNSPGDWNLSNVAEAPDYAGDFRLPLLADVAVPLVSSTFLRLTPLFHHHRHHHHPLLLHRLLTSVSFLKKGNKVLKF